MLLLPCAGPQKPDVGPLSSRAQSPVVARFQDLSFTAAAEMLRHGDKDSNIGADVFSLDLGS